MKLHLPPINTKVVLGLSGGVDSAVSAVLLKEQGYEVETVYLECWHEPGCRAEEDRQDALQIALQLELPFQVLDLKKEYKERVMQYFLDEYQAGKTPNPDVMCNKIIKFGLFYDWAIKQGYDALATGHYAATDGQGLYIPVDTHKDQSYFLYQIKSSQLPHILFPLQELTKDQVRTRAKQEDLLVAAKKDSVGICFVGDINVPKFLEENLGKNPGEIVDEQGNVVGKHQGLWFYTIGQRHGFEYDKKLYAKYHPDEDKTALPALYVINKDPEKNQLVIGTQQAAESQEMMVNDLHLIGLEEPELLVLPDLRVRIRNTGKLVDCEITKQPQDYLVSLAEPLAGVAAGQAAVFYDSAEPTRCLGGATIL